MPLGDITVRLHKSTVVLVEEEVEIDGEVTRDEVLVAGQEFLTVWV